MSISLTVEKKMALFFKGVGIKRECISINTLKYRGSCRERFLVLSREKNTLVEKVERESKWKVGESCTKKRKSSICSAI